MESFPFPFGFDITRDPNIGYPILDQCLIGTLDSFASFWRTVATTFSM